MDWNLRACSRKGHLVAAVLYLILGKRLFGVRGGHAAHEASLLAVKEATAAPPSEPLAATP